VPSPAVPSGLVLERLGEVSVDVDGKPRPAVGWRIEAEPEFLASIPRELLARDAEPSAGTMTLVLRVAPDHPAVARMEAMIREMFADWSAPSDRDGVRAPSVQQAALLAGPPDPCLIPCYTYSCDGAGDLVTMDQSGGPAFHIGNMGVTMFAIAMSSDYHLYGISAGSLYLINGCNAQVTLLGPSSLASGLCGDLATDGLFAVGPPLERIALPAPSPEVVGGFCCGSPPSWCGLPTGDISHSNATARRLYSALACAACAGDMLVALDTASGGVLEEIGCLQDPFTLLPISNITGLTWFCYGCLLVGGVRDSDLMYLIDPATARIIGYASPPLYSGTFGFASLPYAQPYCSGLSCDATADAPGCSSVQVHASAADREGNPLTYAWSSTCAGASFAPDPTAADPLVTVESGCGTCTFDLAVDNGNGAICNDSVDVAFDDVVPPIVDASAVASCLWPPNHRFVDIGLAASASDDCAAPGDLALRIISVTSDEATATEPGAGGPVNGPDAIVDGLTVRLRAERSGLSDGRVYRITVKAVDLCGNEGEAVVEVRVPHDQGSTSPGRRRGNDVDAPCTAIDSGQRYDATAGN
jgi:hypothetical protein